MRRLIPLTATTLLTLVSLCLAVTPVLAGGVAVVVPDATDGRATRAGDVRTFAFTVLQHGVTPVTSLAVSVVITDTGTGERITIAAIPDGDPGHYAADVRFPRPGWWSWHVVVDGLRVESAPTVLGVVGADGMLPGYDPAGTAPRAETLPPWAETEIAQLRARLDAALGARAALTAERDGLRADLEAARADLAAATGRGAEGDGIPLVLVALVALVAAAAGALLVTAARGADRVRELGSPGAPGLSPGGPPRSPAA